MNLKAALFTLVMILSGVTAVFAQDRGRRQHNSERYRHIYRHRDNDNDDDQGKGNRYYGRGLKVYRDRDDDERYNRNRIYKVYRDHEDDDDQGEDEGNHRWRRIYGIYGDRDNDDYYYGRQNRRTVYYPAPVYRNGNNRYYRGYSKMPPGQAKKIYGYRSAKAFAPGQQKKRQGVYYPYPQTSTIFGRRYDNRYYNDRYERAATRAEVARRIGGLFGL